MGTQQTAIPVEVVTAVQETLEWASTETEGADPNTRTSMSHLDMIILTIVIIMARGTLQLLDSICHSKALSYVVL